MNTLRKDIMTSRMNQRKRVAIATAVLTVASLGLITQAQATMPNEPTETLEEAQIKLANQDPTEWAKVFRAQTLTDALLAVGKNDPKFSAISYDAATGSWAVGRTGGTSDRAMAARYTALAKADVPVTVIDKGLPLRDTNALSDRLNQDLNDLRINHGVWVLGHGQEEAGLFNIDVKPPLSAAQEELLLRRYGDGGFGRAHTTIRVRDDRTLDMGVPKGLTKQLAGTGGRWHDKAPFYGGAASESWAQSGFCTYGWGAVAADGSGYNYLVAPLHCANFATPTSTSPATRVWYTGEGIRTGQLGETTTRSDAARIQGIPPGQLGGPPEGTVTNTTDRIYDGDEYGEDSFGNIFSKKVVGTKVLAHGVTYCVSGTYSGVACGGVVHTWQATWTSYITARNSGDFYWKAYGWWGGTESTNFTVPMAGPGDSGAPVFQPISGTNGVYALGTHVMHQGTALPCRGITSRGTTCGGQTFTTLIRELEPALHLKVVGAF